MTFKKYILIQFLSILLNSLLNVHIIFMFIQVRKNRLETSTFWIYSLLCLVSDLLNNSYLGLNSMLTSFVFLMLVIIKEKVSRNRFIYSLIILISVHIFYSLVFNQSMLKFIATLLVAAIYYFNLDNNDDKWKQK